MIRNDCTIRTVRLYGVLGARFGRVHRLAVASCAEAVRALGHQLRGFNEFLATSKDRGLHYAVFYGKKNLSKDQLTFPAGDDDIRIAPIISGAKKGGVFQIIIGIILVVVGVIINAYTGAGGNIFIQMGVAMIVGGIVQLLTPTPKGRGSKDRPENEPSYAFNGPLNTQAQGNPVPLLYGELIVGSAVISAGIDAVDHAIVFPGNGGGGGEGGGGGTGGVVDGGGWNGGGIQDYIDEWNADQESVDF